MRRPERPRVTMGAVFGGALFATAVAGWFWIAELGAVGLGWQPLADEVQRIAQAVRR